MSTFRHRALKLSRHVPDGDRLFSHLTSKATRTVILRAADEGVPPVERISPDLSTRFPHSLESLQARQFVGVSVRAILEEEGYEILNPKVRISGDPVFKIGASYRKAPRVRKEADATWVDRFVKVMTRDEAERAMALLTQRLVVA